MQLIRIVIKPQNIRPMGMFRIIMSAIILFLTMASCTGDKERVEHIPDKAAGVGIIDFNRISSKAITWEELFSMESVERLLKDEEESNFQKLIQSGVDLNNRMYVFGVPEQEEQDAYSCLVFAVKDPKAIENTLKEEDESWNFEDGEEGIRICTREGNSNGMMGLSDKTGIMVFSNDGKVDEALLNNLYNLNSSKALVNADTTFQEVAEKDADILAWINNKKVGDVLSDFSPSTYLGGSDLPKSQTTFVTNFKKGEMTIDTKVISNTDSIGPYQRMYQGSINQDILNNLNTESPLFLTSMAFDMDEVMKILEQEDLFKKGNSLMQRQIPGDLTAKEVVKSVRGDIAGSFKSLTNQTIKRYSEYKEDTMEIKRKMGRFKTLLGLKKPDVIESMLNNVSKEYGMIEKIEKGEYKAGPYVGISVSNNLLAIKGPANRLDKMADNKEKSLPKDLKQMIENNALLYHLNFNAIGDNIKQLLMTFIGEKEAIESFPVESITQTTNNNLSKITKSQTKVKFNNKDQNCLITIKDYLSSLSESSEAM